MSVGSQTLDNQPWYRHGWPWFLFGLPAVSVVVGIALYVIANVWEVDSIVAGDYAKDGKGVELRVERFRQAQSLGLSAHATVREDTLSIKLSATQEKDLPAVLRLNIIHPTQDRFDQIVLLQRGEDGVYSGPIKPLHASRWQFQLEDETRAWSMTGDANIPMETEVSIEPFHSGRINPAESLRPSDS
ncbi:MAG: FixH family protein [Betaproteobacteria bacterium]|nr:FixH family protein [Betaproteobacteria bacterium]MCL2162005.1 FixH family protein [Betaproteobacteria bacterium]